MENMVAQNGIDNVADSDGQRRVCDVPRPDTPTARLPARARALPSHQPASAAMTSADCTTSACRGKMRPVRNSCTSASESEQQSSTTYRL